MRYVTIRELSGMIRENLWKIPHDVDLVVGIPRSGLMVANMIALYLNKRLADIDSFVKGNVFECGERGRFVGKGTVHKVLVVDDSVWSGGSMARAKAKLVPLSNQYGFVFASPIVSTQGKDFVDVFFEIIDDERVFEWNLFHHSLLQYACLDIDGVLNVDPTFEMDDDGPTYIDFLKNAVPLYIPTVPINTLISCRLEKYRSYTEQWLKKYNVQYNHLVMLDLPSKAERLKWNKHGEYKARYYMDHNELLLFIESSKEQAQVVADYTKKPVICVETNSIVSPMEHVSTMKKVRRALRHKSPKFYDMIKKVFAK